MNPVKRIHGGEYIRCKCGAWFRPISEKQTSCVECKKKARTEECHKYAPELWGMV